MAKQHTSRISVQLEQLLIYTQQNEATAFTWGAIQSARAHLKRKFDRAVIDNVIWAHADGLGSARKWPFFRVGNELLDAVEGKTVTVDPHELVLPFNLFGWPGSMGATVLQAAADFELVSSWGQLTEGYISSGAIVRGARRLGEAIPGLVQREILIDEEAFTDGVLLVALAGGHVRRTHASIPGRWYQFWVVPCRETPEPPRTTKGFILRSSVDPDAITALGRSPYVTRDALDRVLKSRIRDASPMWNLYWHHRVPADAALGFAVGALDFRQAAQQIDTWELP
jgi:hypothetical protein